MSKQTICPECGQADLVEKASTIYLLGMGLKRDAGQAGAAWLAEMEEAPLKQLGRRLAPPTGGRAAPVRPLHPDLVVLTFSLILPVFLVGIWNTQPGMRIPAVVLLVAFYGLYLWQRRRAIQRFERQKAEQKATAARIQGGIERWMRLYYCAREDVIFAPGREAAPADQLPGYLMSDDA